MNAGTVCGYLVALSLGLAAGTAAVDVWRAEGLKSSDAALAMRVEAAERRLGELEGFVRLLANARTGDVAAVNRATSNLWNAVTNSAAGVGAAAVKACAERLRDYEDRMLESHERRIGALERRLGCRPRRNSPQ